jgi:hypothetical protein
MQIIILDWEIQRFVELVSPSRDGTQESRNIANHMARDERAMCQSAKSSLEGNVSHGDANFLVIRSRS